MNEEYLNSLYTWITSQDETFKAAHTPESFAQKMSADKAYAAKMYEWIVGMDASFSQALPVDAFMKRISSTGEPVKKKDGMVSWLGDGSLEPQGFDRPVVAQDNTRVASRPVIDPRQFAEQKAATEAYEKQRPIDMAAFVEGEEKKKQEIRGVEKAQREGLWQDPTFAAKLNLIDTNLIGQNDTEVLPILREKFGMYGFVFEEGGFLGFGDNIIVKNKDGSKSMQIDLDAWTDSGEIAESEKLREFIRVNADIADERSVVDDEISKAMRAKQLRTNGRRNEDGTVSTVKFQSANIDGKEVVYPTLFPYDGEGAYGSDPDWWQELDGMEAYELAKKRGEVFSFNSQEEAQRFAEGSWKDVSNLDAEGQIFYKQFNKDYIQEKKRYDEYISVRDKIDFIEDAKDGDLDPSGKKKYPNLFVNGVLRDDYEKVLQDLKYKEDELYDIVMDDDSQREREAWDLQLSKRQIELSKNAVTQNYFAKQKAEQVAIDSYKQFGVSPAELINLPLEDPRKQQQASALLKDYLSLQSIQQDAADKYEIANTYYDAKANKTISKEFSDNLAGVVDEISTGWSRGLAAEVILMATLGIEYDMNDPDLRRKAAEKLVEYSNAEGDTQSRALARYAQATGGKEVWDVIKSDPAELFGAWAFGSLAQLLPYGMKIVPTTTIAGVGVGAGIGATGFATGPGGVVTTGAGAVTGGLYGFRTGMGLASLAMEYGNEMIDAITTQGYDISDPESVAAALGDESVWDLGRERGLKRGIPIALVDFVSFGTVGKLFKVGSVATKGARIGAVAAERMLVDPAAEALGETLAQINVGDELDYKEIIAEAGGGIGNNSSYVAINMLKNARAKTNLGIATNLMNLDFMSREVSSDKSIADWANNMHKLGKIDADQNQRIQENVGLRAEARNLLDVGGNSKKYSGAVESRVMTLLAAREELSSTPNRKSVFSNKISEINAELEEIATTKKVRGRDQQTLLAGTGVLSAEEQSTGTDIRQAPALYQIGKKKVTKEQFLASLKNMSVDELKNFNGRVENDEEVLNMVMEKLLPYQKTPSVETTLDETGTLVETPVAEGVDLISEEALEAGVVETPVDLTPEESQALLSEVSDLETVLSQPEGRVDFRLKSEDEVGPAADEVEAEVRAINAMPSGNVSTTVSSRTQGVKIDAVELGSRTTKAPKSISIDVTNGIPSIFTITDQLTTGDVVNPNTGNTISNLKGGVGYTFIEDAAWANTTEKEAGTIITKALSVYENNKPLFEKWWAANPEYKGLVPMNVVKMGEGSLLSNEATFRVLQDNLTKFPEQNKVEALNVLKARLQDIINTRLNNLEGKTDNTIKNYKKEADGLQDILNVLNESNVKSIEDVISKDVLDKFNLPTRRMLIESIAYGSPNRANESKKPGQPTTPVAKALLQGQPKEMASLLNLGSITDLITEPQLKNVPQRSIVSIQGVDVLNPKIIETTHPNYKYGVAGRSIGVLNESAAIQDIYPEAYNSALKGLTNDEAKGKKYTDKQVEESKTKKNVETLEEGQLKPSSIGTILTETLGVQNGLPGLEFVGAVANGDISNATKLTNFLNTAFPSVVISTDSETFNNVINSEGVQQYLKGDEVIYGVTTNGDIYINPDVHSSESALFNTTIHEMGHVWTDYLKTTEKGKQIYAKGLELAKQTDEYQRQLKKFNGDSIKAANETLAVLIGNKGQTIADASIQSKFEEWLLGMWKYIKQQFKMSKDLSEQEIQDLTLDEFIGTALADIFNGKEIKMTDEQLKQLKNPDAAFSRGLSMDSIVAKGRQNGFSDASIKQVLLGRGFKAADITAAMSPEYMLDLFTVMPYEFGNLEGGVVEGRTLFNEVRNALNNWSVTGPRGGVGTVRTKTYADIRQKGMELMKANEIFKNQPEQTQKEILSAFDKSLGIRANPNVQRQISAIRNDLKQRRIGENNLKSAQIRLKNFIRANLPKSNIYSQADINKLVSLVSGTNVAKFEANTEKVLKIVEQQRAKMKKEVVKNIFDLVSKKSQAAVSDSGKRRSAGLDAKGQSFFAAAKPVLRAILKGDVDALNKLILSTQEINEETGNLIVDEAINKDVRGERLSVKEQKILNQALALDTFSDLDNLSLEETKEILADLKSTRGESIARLKSNRALRAQDNLELAQEAKNSISKNYGFLFNANGNLKNITQLNAERKQIWQNFKSLKIWEGIRSYFEQYDFTNGVGVAAFFRNYIQHLGTYSNILDKNTDGFFTKNVYRYLNQMDENYLKGYYRQREQMDRMANSIPGNTKGYTQFRENLSDETLKVDGITNLKTGDTFSDSLNVDQLMRIYALSKNSIQMEKLNKMGFSDAKIQDIKDFIGPEAVQMADMMVEYFSDTYFDEVNDVYRTVNDTNLGYVPNYFPTRTISSKATVKLLQDGNFNGVFDAENAPALKERTDRTNDIDIEPGFINVVENHFQSMERYKAYAEGVKKLNALMSDPAVNTLLEQTGMKSLYKLSINSAINPNAGPDASKIQSVAEWLARRFTGFALAFKSIQVLKQATSFVQAFEDYSYRPRNKRIRGVDTLIDIPMFAFDYAKVIFKLRSEVKKATEISATFRNRLEKGMEGEVYGLESGRNVVPSLSRGNSRSAQFSRGFKKAGGAPTVAGDMLGVMGYMANYNRDISNGMSKAEALERFNNYNATQQTRRATEKNQLQLQQNFAFRAVTMFGSTIYLQMNKVMQSAARIMQPILKGKPGEVKTKDIRAFTLNLAVANVAFAFAANIMKFAKGNDKDKEAALQSMKDAMVGLNLVYQIPLLGAAIEDAIKKSRGDRSPTSDIVNPIASVLRKVEKGVKTGEPLKIIQPVFEMAVGTQVDPFIGFGEMILGQGDDESFYDLTGISPSYRPGYGQNPSKGSSTKVKQPTKAELKSLFPNNPELWK